MCPKVVAYKGPSELGSRDVQSPISPLGTEGYNTDRI